MEFSEFKDAMQIHVKKLLKDQQFLFITTVDKYKLWELYLDSFPDGTNEIYRERREFDCSCCRHFIKEIGNVVVIQDNTIKTIWDFKVPDKKYQTVLKALSKFIKKAEIKDVFVTQDYIFGTDYSHEQLKNGTVHTWDHFQLTLPKRFTISTRSSQSIGQITGNYRNIRNVFKRSLDEISKDAIETVCDLIAQNSLYKGEEWKIILQTFSQLHNVYKAIRLKRTKEIYCWAVSVKVGSVIGKIRNHSIGTLLTNISEGMPLDLAVSKYETMVAPVNYKRSKAIFTKKMIEQAQQKIEELGLVHALERRHTSIQDIKINNILFANKDTAKQISGDVFSKLQKDITINPKKLDKVEDIPIEQFITEILPNITSIEMLFENKHIPNLMSIISPAQDSDTLFKWNNSFSWAYNGNITDSMKKHVKAAGGNVEGVLRYSILWNDGDNNQNDFDAHCTEPDGNEIYYPSATRMHLSSGILDVDIKYPGNKVAVENIIYTDSRKMIQGAYKFAVFNYAHNGGRTGFSAEIEFDGIIHSFEYNKELKQNETVQVAIVTLDKNKVFKITKSLPSTTSTKTIWGIQTNQFHPVSICMFSPNYWDEQKGIGNKHYFFILNNCQNEDSPNGFFNEFLREELYRDHKQVFEALAAKQRVKNSNDQLSGLGFSSTIRNSVLLKVKGHFTRTIKVSF